MTKVLLIDNYDSFTYNLYDCVARNNVYCDVVKNNEISVAEIETLNYDGIILSPGPKTPDSAGITKQVIRHFYDKKPVFGICLGHQAIGELFGATLTKAEYPMHGKTSEIFFEPHYLFANIASPLKVMRYHSLILENVNAPLRIIARTETGEIMAIAHDNGLLSGVQFHPESVLTEQGELIINNWLLKILSVHKKTA